MYLMFHSDGSSDGGKMGWGKSTFWISTHPSISSNPYVRPLFVSAAQAPRYSNLGLCSLVVETIDGVRRQEWQMLASSDATHLSRRLLSCPPGILVRDGSLGNMRGQLL